MASRSDTAATADAPTESVATALSAAAFVRVLPRADGDALAAAGLLARALRRVGVPFHVRVDALGADAPASDDGLLVAVGADRSDADVAITTDDGPASLRAYDVAAALGRQCDSGGDESAPDPVLALAGVVAAGAHPGSVAGSLLESAEETDSIARRPGVAIPGSDLVDGLAHSTLFHAPFSGDRDAVVDELSSLSLSADAAERGDDRTSDAETRRSVASLLALAVAGDGDATPRAATAVERALRPYATPDAPMATLGGFADVLNAAARERPGTGVALALGHGGRDSALDAWRDHAEAVHEVVRSGHTGRYDGVFVVHGDDVDGSPGRLSTLSRLVRDFRSPEPVVVALGDGVAALAATESGADAAAAALASEFVSADAAWTGDATQAVARFDAAAADADVIAAVREAVR
ncbi:hypothetical protein [Halobellus sp. GM3]|uniref:hypothetical protein n=1 Tax=Halobellus sp. GM3 TaxID=3458410 RepID=UPI00403D93A6